MKNNKHLDDLFAEARREEPIISEQNAREILAGSKHMQPSPFIFSTKGIIMSTIGLSLAAFIGYLAFSGSPQAPVSTKNTVSAPVTNLLAHSIPSATDEPKKSDDKVVKKLIVIKKSNDKIPTTPPIPQLPPIITTPVKVTGIKPFEISSGKFEKLGITKEDDGKVIFSQKTKEGKIWSVSFTGSDMIVIGDNNPKNTTDAPEFAPVIVTDTKGNKRLMQLSSEGKGIKMNAMEVNSRWDNDTGYGTTDVINKGLKISAINIEQDSNIGLKINIPGKHGDDDIELNLNNDPHSKHPMISHNRRSISMKKIIHFDSLLKAKAMNEDNIEEVLKDINFDSTFFKSKNFNINILKDEVVIDNDNNTRDSIENAAISYLDEMIKHANDLDNLIPILIRPATTYHDSKAEGITYDDGLIFWYKPEKAINDIIPEAQAIKSTPAVKNKISFITETVIYPNPAKNSTTVHFTLSEPRTLAFSIHDLLGKRVLDGGSIVESSAGSFEHELTLSSLPAGVYLLVITTDKGEQTMQRLVIEK